MNDKKKRLPLTRKERGIWAYILGFYTDNDYMPTRQEIADNFGYPKASGRQAIQSVLNNIQAKGYLKMGRHWREIRLIEKK